MKDLKLASLPPTVGFLPALPVRFNRGPFPGQNGLTLHYTGVTSVEVDAEDGAPFELIDYHSLRLDEILPHPTG